MTSLNFTDFGKPSLPEKAKEADVQKACWKWLGLTDLAGERAKTTETIQDYAYMVPNGTQLGGSHRGRARYMASLKAQGFRAGVSDIVIAYPTIGDDFGGDWSGHCGAYIELKRDRASYGGPAAIASAIRAEQADWLRLMHKVGYYVAVPYGLEEFQSVVRSYLSGETQLELPDYLKQE